MRLHLHLHKFVHIVVLLFVTVFRGAVWAWLFCKTFITFITFLGMSPNRLCCFSIRYFSNKLVCMCSDRFGFHVRCRVTYGAHPAVSAHTSEPDAHQTGPAHTQNVHQCPKHEVFDLGNVGVFLVHVFFSGYRISHGRHEPEPLLLSLFTHHLSDYDDEMCRAA